MMHTWICLGLLMPANLCDLVSRGSGVSQRRPCGCSAGERSKSCHVWRFGRREMLFWVVGRRGTLWHLDVCDHVSQIVLCERRTTFYWHVCQRWFSCLVAGGQLCVCNWRFPRTASRGAMLPLLWHFAGGTHCTLHSTFYTLYSAFRALHFTAPTLPCTVSTTTLHTLHSTVYTPQSTPHSLHSTLHTHTRPSPHSTV